MNLKNSLNKIFRYRELIFSSLALGFLFVTLNFLEYRLLILQNAVQLYVGIIALAFTGLGIWLALKLSLPKKEIVIVEKEIPVKQTTEFTRDEAQVAAIGLSRRELEVLECMAEGLSNQEIGEKLFVSVNTVKTHNSNILQKLEVKRRTQAIEKARRVRVIR